MVLLRCVLTALLCCAPCFAQGYVNFECGATAPARVSADGSRLFVADTTGDHLSVFDLRDSARPQLVAEIPVGIAPVAVQPRTRDEVWVVNQLSDSVSVVDVPSRQVVATIRVVDEPSDVVFAGGKAFVSAATRDELQVFDATTHAALGDVDVFGKDPRALATSPDGSKVYAVIQRSGNGTTVLPASVAPTPPPPTNVTLPAAPQQGLIVRADDPQWASHVPYTLPDHDVAEIDVASQTVTRYFDAIGTTNTAIAVHPTTGALWVANLDARNLVRFEPALRGHAIDSRVTEVTTGAAPTVTHYDLNPGVDYSQLPNPSALATALAEPFGVAVDAAGGRIYVAAHGTDRVGVLDAATGAVLTRIEVGSTPGAAVDTRNKRGPRGLALHPTAPSLYVVNTLSNTLVVVDTQQHVVVHEQPIATVDPMPAWMREGRKFLYDSKLSGNGTMSCASCHVDGDTDGIAWDLGDPGGSMEAAPQQPFPFSFGVQPFHPMKGPLTTQTLRGLKDVGVLHWRGDKADFHSFNGAFDKLMGGSQLSNQDMASYADFATEITFPPNPNQLLDRSLRTTPAGANEADGFQAYHAPVGFNPLLGTLNCNICHTLPTGTNGFVVAGTILQTEQQMKVAQLRNMYRKTGFVNAPGPQKSGFGFTHTGATDTLVNFLSRPVFNSWPAQDMDDIVAYLHALDTGTAPLVGFERGVDAANISDPQVLQDIALLENRALAGDIELVARGVVDGAALRMLYEPTAGLYHADVPGVGPYAKATLQQRIQLGAASLQLLAVPPGSGERLSRDRDQDGVLDGAERAVRYGNPTAGCSAEPSLAANSEPFVGNAQFGFTMQEARPNTLGVFALSLGQAQLTALGVEVLVAPLTASTLTVTSDGFGEHAQPLPLPNDPTLSGLQLFAQAIWFDPCGARRFSSTAGLHVTVRP
ncbi:MAG: beta-propeller fold lactonase family protein [Planctomycetota bacterium]